MRAFWYGAKTNIQRIAEATIPKIATKARCFLEMPETRTIPSQIPKITMAPPKSGCKKTRIKIKNLRHILVSGAYAVFIFILVFFYPDFGGAIVIFGIWLGMVLVSGISKKHLAFVAILGIVASAILWMFVFAPYQKARIVSFIHPLADVRGAGYNAYQSTIAIGSGEIFGKGIGQGS